MTPPRPVEEVARALCNATMPKPHYDADAWDNLATWCADGVPRAEESRAERDRFVRDAIAVITRQRELGMFNPETLDLLKHEGQYEATRPSRYVFPAEEGK